MEELELNDTTNETVDEVMQLEGRRMNDDVPNEAWGKLPSC